MYFLCRFSKDETLRSKWLKAVRRQDWMPSKSTKLCFVHFEENMIDRTMNRVLLKSDAVPTIFPAFPSHLQKVNLYFVFITDLSSTFFSIHFFYQICMYETTKDYKKTKMV